MSGDTTSADLARRQETEFHVNGMTCEGCLATVRRSLESLPGVGRSSIDLETGRASVEFDGSRVREQDLIAAVRAAGYGVDSNATLNVSADSPGSGRSASHSGAGAASATLDTPTALSSGPSSQARPALVMLESISNGCGFNGSISNGSCRRHRPGQGGSGDHGDDLRRLCPHD